MSYGLSVLLSLIVAATGRHESPYAGWGLLAMFFPAIAVLAVRVTGGPLSPAGWKRFPLAFLPLSLFLIPVAAHLAMVPVVAVLENGVPWQDWLTPRADGLFHSPESRGWGVLTGGELAGRISLNAAVGLLVITVFALFEEVGWRAWLLPRLANELGPRRGVLATALVWALWHIPFALSGIHHLPGVSTAATAMIAPIGHVGAGLIIGWLWLRTESIWIVSLAHGALNNWGQYAFKYMEGFGEHDAALLLSENLALLVVGAFLVTRFLDVSPQYGAT